jgi:hypothetical protein
MDAENLANDPAKSPEPEGTTGMDSGDPGSLRDVGAKSERSAVSSTTQDSDPLG